VGKWHLGHARPEQRPLARGFDGFYGCLQGYVDYYLHTRNDELDWWRGEEQVDEGGYATRLLALESARILGEQAAATKPLFLFVSFTAPHTPLQPAPERSVDGLPEEQQKRACYIGMVEELDAAIGVVLDALDEHGLAEDTLVFFASDNGGSPRHGADNAPLRDGKFGTFEGGIRVPAVARWPGKLPAGAVSDQLATVQDLLPTFAETAGAKVPRGLDGESVLGAWRAGETRARGDLAFGVHRPNSHRYALRRGRFKLVEVRNLPEQRTETMLFDVEADPEESRDLAAENPELLRELSLALAGFEALEER
jgi:arylsulfatase A-like enzyme